MTGHIPPKYTIPPMPPHIHRRLSLGKTDKGLVLLPQIDGPAEGVLIKWGVKGGVTKWVGDAEELVELGGVLGISRLWDSAYLLVFLPFKTTPLFPSHKKSPYQFGSLGMIHSIPLTQELAGPAIAALQKAQAASRPKGPRRMPKWNFGFSGRPKAKEESELKRLAESGEEGVEEGEEEEEEADTGAEETGGEDHDDHDDDEGETEDESEAAGDSTLESIAPEADESPIESPIHSPLPNADKRFSWNNFIPKRKQPAPPGPDIPPSETAVGDDQPNVPNKPFPADGPQRRDLETKIIRQIIREFSTGGFFFSYDFDLTHSLQHKRHTMASRHNSEVALASLLGTQAEETYKTEFIEPDVQVPLWRRVDRRFFWNEYLMKDFIDAGLHAYILPVMQGWIQSRTFVFDQEPIDFVVISRRSRDRAGLRYQRRGIDDEGHVANFVETEMIVRANVEDKISLFSFVQIRGSIPLKWSQSPYSMKPPPVLDTPVDQSYSVANLHFNDLTHRYGPITCINLSEQNGKERVVTNGYRDLLQQLDRKDVTYKGFDFHAKCHGMKWENISELVDELDFGKMGYFWTLTSETLREQEGVFRTNCIDCLDRTNVVQSAIARHVLTEMLTQLGLVPDASDIENVFNDVWANNGDMLSLCYAHTSALKGDFVRTGKRDFQGMINDGISSLSRMFYGAISDFFAQAVISFFLGHRNLGVFSEFLESLESSEATHTNHLAKLRVAAIETSTARVIDEDERRLAGWVLLSPEHRNVIWTPKLEERILLLSNAALYVVSFNYGLDKVAGFTRIPLASISGIEQGAYIISALQEAGRDPNENAGFLIRFSPSDEDTRYSTYSIRNTRRESDAASTVSTASGMDQEDALIDPNAVEVYAFKVLTRDFEDAYEDEDDEGTANTCLEMANKIAKRISRQCAKCGSEAQVVSKDVVGVGEAERATSVLSRVDYAFKRFLWL